MTCQCAELPNCVTYGDSETEFVRLFEFVDQQPWLRLYCCRYCHTLWRLDVDDRSNFAIKIPEANDWAEFDAKPLIRDFIIRFHGGEGLDQCKWANCQNRVLKNMALCVDHAFPEFSLLGVDTI